MTLRYEFTGNGKDITIATVPKELSFPQHCMFVAADWTPDGSWNTHIQFNKDNNTFTALKTKGGILCRGQITIML